MKYFNIAAGIVLTLFTFNAFFTAFRSSGTQRAAVDSSAGSGTGRVAETFIRGHYGLCFAAILAVMLILRIVGLGRIPSWYNLDEAMSVCDADALLHYGTDHYGIPFPVHMKAWGFTHQSAMLTYLMVPFIRIFGYNTLASRIPMLILSIIGAVFLYLFVKDMSGSSAALAAFALCAFNPWHLVQSRYAIDCNVFPHLLIIALFFLQRYLITDGEGYLYLSMAVFGSSLYAYVIAMYSVPFFLVTCCAVMYRKKRVTIRQILLCVLLFLAVMWPIAAAMLLNVIGLEQDVRILWFSIPSLEGSRRVSDVLLFSEHPLRQAGRNLISLFRNVFLQADSWPWDTVEHFGTMGRYMTGVMTGGIAAAAFLPEEESGIREDTRFLLPCWAAACVFSGLMTSDVTVIRRLNIAYYLEIIVITTGFVLLWRYCRRARVPALLCAALGCCLLVFNYFTDYAGSFTGGDSVTYNFHRALEKAGEYDCGGYVITEAGIGKGTPYNSELYALVSLHVDPLYYQGGTTVSYGRDFGREYAEQFRYADIAELRSQPRDAAEDPYVYVINSYDRDLFSKDGYTVYEFGIYDTVVPVQLDE